MAGAASIINRNKEELIKALSKLSLPDEEFNQKTKETLLDALLELGIIADDDDVRVRYASAEQACCTYGLCGLENLL